MMMCHTSVTTTPACIILTIITGPVAFWDQPLNLRSTITRYQNTAQHHGGMIWMTLTITVGLIRATTTIHTGTGPHHRTTKANCTIGLRHITDRMVLITRVHIISISVTALRNF